MTHKEAINDLQRRSGLDRQQCAMLLKALVGVMTREAIDLNEVHLEGVGTFVSTKHPEYIDENVATGQSVLYPPRISYRFQSEMKL